jgi:tRNA(fMet)-specific endonuclease VapC
MGALIDTSLLVAVERGELGLERALEGFEDEPLAVSVITASELLHGVHRARGGARRARREAWVETLLGSIPVLAFDLVAARTHARLWAQLAAAGTAVGAHDLILAATALSRGLDVLTRDHRSFPRIPDLAVVVR